MILPPPTRGDHGNCEAAHQKGAGHVDGDALLPRLLRNLRERRTWGKPGGVVDEDVDTAEIVLHAGDSLPRGLRIRNVALPADRGSALGDDHASGFGRRLRVDVARLNLRPLAGKGERDGPPDSAACAGDQRALAGQTCLSRHDELPRISIGTKRGGVWRRFPACTAPKVFVAAVTPRISVTVPLRDVQASGSSQASTAT